LRAKFVLNVNKFSWTLDKNKFWQRLSQLSKECVCIVWRAETYETFRIDRSHFELLTRSVLISVVTAIDRSALEQASPDKALPFKHFIPARDRINRTRLLAASSDKKCGDDDDKLSAGDRSLFIRFIDNTCFYTSQRYNF